MGRDFADQQLAAEDRDDRAGGRQSPSLGTTGPTRSSEAEDKAARLDALALTQQLAHVAHGEDAEKPLDARADLELDACVL